MVATTLKERYPSYEYVNTLRSRRLIASDRQASQPTKLPRFLGEETYQPGLHLTSAPTFVVDPIDGTVNFVHAYPNFCISLAFVNNLVPLIGVVFNPVTGDLFHAIKGQGAFQSKLSNGASTKNKKLPLRNPPDPLNGLRNALVATESGNEREGNNWEVKQKTFRTLCASAKEGGGMVQALRSSGSAAMNLCAVASGTIDAYWEGGCWAWDVAAGWCILSETMGIMVSANPGEWEPRIDGRAYLAVRGDGGKGGQKAFIEEFWSYVGGKLHYEV